MHSQNQPGRHHAGNRTDRLPDRSDDESGTGSGSRAIFDEAATALHRLYAGQLDDLTIERLVVGVFFVGVKLSNGCAGVAYTPPEVVKNASCRILKAESFTLRGSPAAMFARGDIPSPFAEVIRLATLNALSVPFLEDGRYSIDVSGDASGLPELFYHRRVCVVGAIIPFLKRLQELGTTEVIIIDRKKETREEARAGYGTFVPTERTAECLQCCQTAVFTGAAIANGSIEQLIRHVPEDAAIAVIGPTAGFVPDPLFRRNVALVGTVKVTDSDLALEILAEGGGARQLFGSCVRKINLINVGRLRQLKFDVDF